MRRSLMKCFVVFVILIRIRIGLCAVEFTVTKMADINLTSRLPFFGQTFIATSKGVFSATGPKGYELWSTDGFSVSSFDLNDDGDSRPDWFTDFQGDLYFTAKSHPDAQREWFRSNGKIVERFSDADAGNGPQFPFVYDNRLYYSGFGEHGRELFTFDGTSFQEVADLYPGLGWSLAFLDWHPTEINGKVVFPACVGELSCRMFTLNGPDVQPLSDRNIWPVITHLARTKDWLYFSSSEILDVAREQTQGYIYRTNGTILETVTEYGDGGLIGGDGLLKDAPNYFIAAGDKIYMTALGPERAFDGPFYAAQLFEIDGTQVRELSYNGRKQLFPGPISQLENKLFFRSSDNEFFVIDNGTLRVLDISIDGVTGLGYDNPIGTHQGWMYFTARAAPGFFVMKTNGTEVLPVSSDALPNNAGYSVSTTEGLFIQNDGLLWSDGTAIERIDKLALSGAMVEFEGALYVRASTSPSRDPGYAIYKVVRSDSIARVDFNRNGETDVEDIDLLSQRLRSPEPHAVYDLNEDGKFDQSDRRVWVERFAKTYYGDANLDGQFGTADLVQIWQTAQFEDSVTGNSTWSEGDFNGDGDFTSSDLVLAFEQGGYESGPRISNVPEPAISMSGVIALWWFIRRAILFRR